MGNIINEIITGRKTFFIVPDKSLLPQSYLEEYLNLGYECYFIDNEKFLPLERKIEIILSVFKDSILLFNIDAQISAVNWESLIRKIQNKYNDTAYFGVLYTKRQTKEERSALEYRYLYDIGIQCGCIQLEYQKKHNFGLIEKVLFANQAMGRRKSVRAVCTGGCTLSFNLPEGGNVTGKINDISISHFSCTLEENDFMLKEYVKIHDIAFIIRGLHFRADAIFFMKRPSANGFLYIFTFMAANKQNGLDKLTRQLLIPKIYEIMSDNCSELLNRLFKSAIHTK